MGQNEKTTIIKVCHYHFNCLLPLLQILPQAVLFQGEKWQVHRQPRHS